MKSRLIKLMVIIVIAIAYAMVALPLPYLLLDHSAAMQAGDAHHSDRDVHAWLEWAASSSLTESPPPLPASLAPLPAPPVPSVMVRAVLPDLASHLRGPPAFA